MVIQAHAGEFYYIGHDAMLTSRADAYWVAWYNPLCINAVPLFVMISGFFLFPVGDVRLFLKKRFGRVAIPFVLWCMIYALYLFVRHYDNLRTTLINIANIPVNFGTEVGHLWFVYMLLGIYLFAPVISPWIQSAGRKAMELYLALWAVSLTIPYIHLVVPQIWGETFWNHTPMLYYFSGFLGYVVLANYIKRFHMAPRRWNYIAGIGLIIVGYAISTFGFLYQLPTERHISKLILTWGFETINIAMMTTGIFLMVKNIRIKNPQSPLMRIVSCISAKSYGIYLAHIIILNTLHAVINRRIDNTELKIPILGIAAFVLTYLLVKLLSRLPKSKWLVG